MPTKTAFAGPLGVVIVVFIWFSIIVVGILIVVEAIDVRLILLGRSCYCCFYLVFYYCSRYFNCS